MDIKKAAIVVSLLSSLAPPCAVAEEPATGDDLKKLEESLSIVNLQRSAGKIQESDAEQKRLRDRVLSAASRTNNASVLLRLSRILDRLAAVYSRDWNDHSSMNTACSLKFDALSVIDRLPEKSPQRISAHRSAVAWFKGAGKVSYADSETKVLAKLLNTTDPNVLFPPRRPCIACGRG